MPKLLKNILFTLWYIFYIRQSYLYLILNPEQNLSVVSNQYIHGAYLLIWPITLCHLESFRTKGEMLNFNSESWNNFSQTEKVFVMLPLLASMFAFWIMNFIGILMLFEK
jgi:hypothetical protein